MKLLSVRKQAPEQIMGGTRASSKYSCYASRVHHPATGDRKIFQRRLSPMLPIVGLSLLFLLSLSCGKKATAPIPASIQNAAKLPPSSAPPAITPTVVPSSKPLPTEPGPAPKAVAMPSNFDLGLANFKAGNYGKAVQLFEEYLQAGLNSENRDVALFHLYLSRRLSGNSGRNTRRAEEALKRIVTEYPKSPYRDSAEYILGLQAQIENLKSDNKDKEAKIKQLSDELQKLKEIDMQRRPSRPLY
jgi:TolA-binding protein